MSIADVICVVYLSFFVPLFLYSVFDFGRGAFTAPARPLLTPAAAQSRLAAVPGRLDSHRRAASV
eukprot:4968660-Prymnesium_polylepis.1